MNWRARTTYQLRHTSRQFLDRLSSSSQGHVDAALELLAPIDGGVALRRVGGDGDGGYLVPDDLDGLVAAPSPGVSATWTFESDMAELGVKSFMLDGSIAEPPGLGPLQHFDQLWLAPRTRGDDISLADWVCRYNREQSGDLILQMDIEGAEYGVLASTPENILSRFRIVVIEFHGLERMKSAWTLRRRILPALRKLDRAFEVVHLHPNNCCPIEVIRGRVIPSVVEVTYLRRDRLLGAGLSVELPHPLDRDCVPGNLTIHLPARWPFG